MCAGAGHLYRKVPTSRGQQADQGKQHPEKKIQEIGQTKGSSLIHSSESFWSGEHGSVHNLIDTQA